jgi:hypothetical protein
VGDECGEIAVSRTGGEPNMHLDSVRRCSAPPDGCFRDHRCSSKAIRLKVTVDRQGTRAEEQEDDSVRIRRLVQVSGIARRVGVAGATVGRTAVCDDRNHLQYERQNDTQSAAALRATI